VSDLRDLTARFPRAGRLDAILLRPERRAPVRSVEEGQALAGRGLEGDRMAQRVPSAAGSGKRQVTLIQAEHLPVIAALARVPAVDAVALRRNLVVSGINLLALKNARIQIGDAGAVLEVVGPCAPCSRMEEEAIGPGGYAAMRGHGGMTARVLATGAIRIGDAVCVVA